MYETLGEKIVDLRKKAGLSQYALSLGICSQSEISRIERGIAEPSYFLLISIANKLNVDIKYLLNSNSSNARHDYVGEVKDLLAKARRKRDYNLVEEIVTDEENKPLFSGGEPRSYLLWNKGIAIYHLKYDSVKAIETLKSALSNTEVELLYSELDTNILNSICIIYRNETQFSCSRWYFEIARKLTEEHPLRQNYRLRLKVLYNLSKVYTNLGDHSQSLDLCKIGLRICNDNEDMFLLADFHYQMGRNYLYLDNNENGMDNWEKAKQLLSIQGKKELLVLIEKEINYYKSKGELM